MKSGLSHNYIEYIHSETWREKAEERKKIDGYKCAMCGNSQNLEVHHRHYKSLGDEDVETDLVTLCKECHKAVHENKEYIVDGICTATLAGKMNNLPNGVETLIDKLGFTNKDKEIRSMAKDVLDYGELDCVHVFIGKERGAIVIPHVTNPWTENTMKKVCRLLGEDFKELKNIATRLYYFASTNPYGCECRPIPEYARTNT